MVIYQRINKVNTFLNSPSLRGNEREGLAQRAKPSWVTTITAGPTLGGPQRFSVSDLGIPNEKHFLTLCKIFFFFYFFILLYF